MITVRVRSIATAALLVAALGGMAACSREQQDWRAAESADTIKSYGQFIEQHPESELVKGARARVAQLAEDLDWREAAKADTADAYLQFLAKHPNGKWVPEARIRAQNFALSATTQGEAAGAVGAHAASGASANAAPAASGTPDNTAPTGSGTPAATTAPTATAVPGESAVPAARVAPAGTSVSGAAVVPPAGAVLTSASASMPGIYGIQLGAFTSEDRANAEWRALQGRFAEQLQGLAPQVVSAETPSGRVFRLQARAGDESHARLICEQLRQHSQGCVPVVPH